MGKTQKIVGLLLMLVALGLAAYAWLVSSRMAAEQKAAQPKMQPVVVAQTRIAAGSLIGTEMLKVSMFPTRPDGSYSDIAAVTGKTASADIAIGEAILTERLGGGLRAMLQHIDPSERAVAIRVDEVVAVGNKLVPGDWVDVFFTLHRNNAEVASTQSRLLLDNLQVLAFGSRDVGGAAKASADGSAPTRSSETPKTAVLAVKIADIDKLVLAAESGRLILALRPHAQPATPEAAVTPAPGTTTKTEPAKAVATAASGVQPALTLKQLVAMTGGSEAAPAKAGAPAGKRSAGRKAGDSVIVMHGLEEKSVRVTASSGAKP